VDPVIHFSLQFHHFIKLAPPSKYFKFVDRILNSLWYLKKPASIFMPEERKLSEIRMNV
jgi:hypothetical protein